ncbi:MAG TPA: NTP transferase domain-containing protein [Candidatus Saccharimonadales bacterium]|nr:NTP transferase domain-containing protein [Candidatus Saccharimonadales bacterium]
MTARASLILAAGKGTRMKSDLAKVLHAVDGRALVEYVVDTVEALGLAPNVVVVGHQADRVREVLRGRPVVFADQPEQLGTGDAVRRARRALRGFQGHLAVLCGDVPFLRPSTLQELFRRHEEGGFDATILTAVLDDAAGYGRILRGPGGEVTGIVEHRDASEEQRQVREINTSTYCFSYPLVQEALAEVRDENSQGEYYLTDTIAVLRAWGRRVGAWAAPDPLEVSGVNTPAQLRALAEYYHRREGG